MLSTHSTGSGKTTLYFLHFLGSSSHEWRQVTSALGDDYRCVAIDLPGFGDSSFIEKFSIEQMRDAVMECIQADAPATWLLVGHSMGAKVAAAIARHAEDGDDTLKGLSGLVLMAGSPPSPEPIPDERRKEMGSWFASDAATSRAQATTFIHNNLALSIDTADREQAIEDVLRMNRAAWLAWLDAGSKEDWSERVGVLKSPTLVLAGEEDPDLGTAAQRRLMLPHFSHTELKTITGAKHLLPLEAAEETAALVAKHAEFSLGHGDTEDYRAFIGSDRVSEKTREALLDRKASEVAGYVPVVFSLEELNTMRAITDSLLPQAKSDRIDIAQYVDRQLNEKGDGWRFAKLPQDKEAYRSALRTLQEQSQAQHGKTFADLGYEQRDEMLVRATDGKLTSAPPSQAALTNEQFQLWLLDFRADAVRTYMAHPSTLARIGYSGIADGGDSKTMQGFVKIGIGETELWEPSAKADTR